MIETLQIPSTTQTGITYTLTINTTDNKVTCTCTGFTTHGYCKHTRIYRQLINQKLYNEPFQQKIKINFNNCYEFIRELCDRYPEAIGDYDKLDHYATNILDAMGKHYRTETIHRAYRLLVENGEIMEPTHHQIRKEKTRTIMHEINTWNPTYFKNFNSTQTTLTREEGIKKI